MSDVKWIKIVTDIFDDEKMLLIESLPSADSIIVIWFKLLCLAGKNNNNGVFMMNDRIAYTDEMLATIFRRDVNTVRLALKTFENYGMIELIDGVVAIPNWGKHQTLDSYEKKKARDREYQAIRREKQRQIAKKSSDRSSDTSSDRSSDVVVSDKEEDKEVERDIEKYNKISCAEKPHDEEREQQLKHDFEIIYAIYPKKVGKTVAFANYKKWISKSGKDVSGKKYRLTNRQIYKAVQKYVKQQEAAGKELEYWKNFDTLMGRQLLDYVDWEENPHE